MKTHLQCPIILLGRIKLVERETSHVDVKSTGTLLLTVNICTYIYMHTYTCSKISARNLPVSLT